MNLIGLCMNIGTGLITISTLPLIYAVWKDRSVLRGYSTLGSLGTLVSIIFFMIAFFKMSLWISVLNEIPVILYWFLAAFYSHKGGTNDD